MNENRNTYQDKSGGERPLQKLLDINVLQLLLAGMYFLFGVRLTKAERLYRREQAIIMRKSISAANRVIEIRKGNIEALSSYTNDYGPTWRARMRKLSNRKNSPHPDRAAGRAGRSRGTRRARIMAANTTRQGTDPSRHRCTAPQDEGVVVRAPP